MGEEVKVFGMWASPFSRRVELALKLKGIEYEYIEEDLSNKSDLLLKYNPAYKKIPVLVHNGNPIAESLVILEYIDETWKHNPILPQHPYDRAMARFWARFMDEKVLRAAHKRALGQEKEKEEAMKELPEYLKLLEHELKGKDFFGGDAIGYVDIVGHVIAFWLGAVKEVTGVEWFTEEEYPSLWKWRERFQENDAANQCRPPREKHHEYIRARLEASQSASK